MTTTSRAGRPGAEQRAAAAAAAWILAFNARWELGLRTNGDSEGPALSLLEERQEGYLALTW